MHSHCVLVTIALNFLYSQSSHNSSGVYELVWPLLGRAWASPTLPVLSIHSKHWMAMCKAYWQILKGLLKGLRGAKMTQVCSTHGNLLLEKYNTVSAKVGCVTYSRMHGGRRKPHAWTTNLTTHTTTGIPLSATDWSMKLQWPMLIYSTVVTYTRKFTICLY